MKTTALIAIMIIIASTVHSQSRVVHGKLTTFDSFPIKNVEVNSKKAGATTMTDELGQFSIVCLEKDKIQVKAKAFKPVQKKVNADTESITMNLMFIDSKENREMAVGYASMSKKNLTYGASILEHDDVEFCSYSNIFDLIEGRLSGVTVSGNDIFVRLGKNSFTPGSSMALYVVDQQPTSDLAWVHPCQVKSINVLKDANAAIYGSQGANGVILIETLK